MKKISVVIPCYNVAEYLDRCMEHILKQTIGLENIEIILVDDASTDGGATLSLIMEYEKRYPENIMVIPLEQNLRQGGARNVGVSYAGGEYLMFCDADDWLVLDAMEILYRMAREYDADVVEFQMKKMTQTEAEAMEMPETAVSHKYMGDADIPADMTDKIKHEVWEYKEDDEAKRKFIISSSERSSLGCIPKMYRLSMIRDNNIRFAEYLICEEPSFTLPVRIYEKKHVLLDTELYCYFQSSGSTMRGSWDNRKFDNIQVWMTIVRDFEERGLLRKYHNELEYLFFGWGFGLGIRMLLARGYILTEEELNLFKKAVFQFFPGVLENPYVVEEKENGWNMLLQALLETELTKENALEFNRMMRGYWIKYQELLMRAENSSKEKGEK